MLDPSVADTSPASLPDGPAARAAAGLVGLARRAPRRLLALALALVAAAVAYSATTLEIRTSTSDMIDGDVPFRRNAVAFTQAFPRLDETIVAVIDAADAPAAAQAADALAARLVNAEAVRDVYVPFSGPFFARNGLLYLDEAALSDLADTLSAAQPFLGPLAQDPSLRGLFGLLTTLAGARDALREETGPEETGTLVDVLEALTRTVDAAAEGGGEPAPLDWRGLVGGVGAAASADAPARRVVVVEPELADGAVVPGRAAIAAVRAAADAVAATDGVRVRLTGEPVLEQAELRTVARGAGTAGLLSVALVAVLLAGGLRSGRAVAGVLVTLACGLIWTAGFAALTIGHLNLISVAFAVPFVGLAVDFGIHFALRAAEHRRAGADVPAALDGAARGVGPSLGLAAVCATVGFFAFVPTDYRGLAELGIISGVGMLVALLASLTVLPALLALWPARIGEAARRRGTGVPLPGGRLLAALPVRRPRAVLAAAAALGLAAAGAAPFAVFDVNPLSLQDPDLEPVETFRDLAADPTTTPYRIDVLTDGRAAAADLADRLRTLPEVGRVITLERFVPSDQDAKLALIDELAWTLTPVLTAPDAAPPIDAADRRAALADFVAAVRAGAPAAGTPGPVDRALGDLADATERFLAYGAPDAASGGPALAALEAAVVADLPRWLDDLRTAMEAGPVGFEDLPESLRERWVAADGRHRVEVQPAAPIEGPRDMRAFADAVLAIAPTATGTPVVVTEASRAVVGAFVEATALTFIGILVLLVAVYRDARDVALTLAPLALAALLTFAASAVLGLSFNFANIIVLPLLLALGVSGCIQVVSRYRLLAAAGGDTAALMASSTPRAVLLSALTTVASFGSLAVSEHRGTASMGELLTIAIAATLFASLLALPALLTLRERAR